MIAWSVVFDQDEQLLIAGGVVSAGVDYTYPIGIVGAEGLGDIPEVINSDRPRLRRHGMIAGDDFLGGRSFRIRFMLDQATWVEDLARLNEATSPCQDERTLLFAIPGIAGMEAPAVENGAMEARQVKCRVRARSIPTTQEYRNGFTEPEVLFYATDPRIYTDASTTAFLYMLPGTNGLTFPVTTGVLSFGGISGSLNDTVHNVGNFPTEWTATIRGAIDNPVLINDTTGAYLGFNISLGASDVLVVDSEARSVTLNGTASRYYTITEGSTWFDLPPGDTVLRMQGTVVTPPEATQVRYRPAWV